ncbi:MAG: cytochrome c [Rudaea sp.]
MKSVHLIALLACTFAANAFAASATDASNKPIDIKVLAVPCEACHGKDGNAIADQYPRLAGQYHDYLAQALREYRSGDRQNPIMGGFAKPLSDAEIDALSRYFAAMPSKLHDLSHDEQGD